MTSGKNVLDRIGPISFSPNEGAKFVIYGKPGTGKTSLWATFPKPILAVICSGGGQRSGELHTINTAEYRKVVRQVVLETSDELRNIVDAMKPGGRLAEYKTLALDHASGFQDLIIKEFLDLDEVPASRTWGMMSQTQWGQCNIRFKDLIDPIFRLEHNVAVVAHEREFKDDSESDIISPFISSALTPGTSGWLYSIANYVVHTFIRNKEIIKKIKVNNVIQEQKEKTKEIEYCARTGPDPIYATKFRVPRDRKMPEVVTDPSYEKLMALVLGRE